MILVGDSADDSIAAAVSVDVIVGVGVDVSEAAIVGFVVAGDVGNGVPVGRLAITAVGAGVVGVLVGVIAAPPPRLPSKSTPIPNTASKITAPAASSPRGSGARGVGSSESQRSAISLKVVWRRSRPISRSASGRVVVERFQPEHQGGLIGEIEFFARFEDTAQFIDRRDRRIGWRRERIGQRLIRRTAVDAAQESDQLIRVAFAVIAKLDQRIFGGQRADRPNPDQKRWLFERFGIATFALAGFAAQGDLRNGEHEDIAGADLFEDHVPPMIADRQGLVIPDFMPGSDQVFGQLFDARAVFAFVADKYARHGILAVAVRDARKRG